MLEEESCGNCRFYLPSPKVCRRYPPTAIMIGIKKGIAALTGDEPMVMPYFPVMMPTGWCGEHRPIEEAQTEN